MALKHSSTKNILNNLQGSSADKSLLSEKIQALLKKHPKVENKLSSFFSFLAKYPESASGTEGSLFSPDDAIIALIETHPTSVNRIVDLFRALMISGVPLTAELFQIVSENMEYAGSFQRLITFLYELNIDIKDLDMHLLASASQFVDPLKYAITSYVESLEDISSDTLSLMLTFPENATELGTLLVTLYSQSYDADELEQLLLQIVPRNMGTVIRTLSCLLPYEIFLLNALNLMSKEPKHVESIHKGIITLAHAEMITAGYLEAVAEHPENANILAKNIILLSNASLIDPNNAEDIKKISELGIGTHFLFTHLFESDSLNKESYNTVCRNSPLLADKEVIDIFHSLPFLTVLNRDDVQSLLAILEKKNPSSRERDELLNVLHNYGFGESQGYQ